MRKIEIEIKEGDYRIICLDDTKFTHIYYVPVLKPKHLLWIALWLKEGKGK